MLIICCWVDTRDAICNCISRNISIVGTDDDTAEVADGDVTRGGRRAEADDTADKDGEGGEWEAALTRDARPTDAAYETAELEGEGIEDALELAAETDSRDIRSVSMAEDRG
jgi:hypothetical protein